MSSRSNKTIAAIRSSASISTMPSTSAWNASGRWSRPEKRIRMRARRSPRVAMTVDVTFVIPTSAIARMSDDMRISTVLDSRADHPTAIVAAKVVGQHLGHRVPVAGRESAPQSVRPLGLPRFPAAAPAGCNSSKRGERGVEVCLVEDLAAVDQVAFDRQKMRSPPLGVEALLRGPLSRVGEDRSEIAQPMHRLDVDADLALVVQRCADVRVSVSPGANAAARRWSMLTQSGVVAGSSCRLNAA